MVKRIKWNMNKMYNYCKEHHLDLPKEGQKYVSLKAFYLYICSKHNYTYKQRWQNHKVGNIGCKYCQFKNPKIKRKKDINYYYNECVKKGVDKPLLNQKYLGNSKKILHKCKNNHIYPQCPSSNLRGVGCPKCRQVNNNHYYKVWNSLGVDLPVKDMNITSCYTKVNFKCNKGHIYNQSVNQHKFYGCPICNESHGERFIRNYLDKHNIVYESQKKFKDLKDKQPLSYDFYLPKQKILIEYQGIQHFESVSFGSKTNSDIQTQQYHDKLKREYAQKYGYTLLEPTYKLDNQEKINNYLDNHI